VDAKLSELLAAWPEASVEAAGIPRDRLFEIFADTAKRPVPTGSVHRLWSVSDLSGQVALAYFAWWVRQWPISELRSSLKSYRRRRLGPHKPAATF
jgi:hypothetical protein